MPAPHDPSPYRAAPGERPVITLREATDPLGVGRPVAFAALVCALVCALVPFGAELHCQRRPAARCELQTHRGLFTQRRVFDVRDVAAVTRTGDSDLRLQGAAHLFARQGDGRSLPLPTRGLYLDPGGHWRNDARLHEAAAAFFVRGEGSAFAVRQRMQGWPERVAGAVAVLASLVGVVAILAAERRSRWLTLTIDPNAHHARGRSIGYGGPRLDRRCGFGVNPRLQRFDDPGPEHLPTIRVLSGDGASLPILTGHAFEHRDAFDRLVARANAALAAENAGPPSPSAIVRFGPSLLALVACATVVCVVGNRLDALPRTSGTVEVVNTADRCELGGMTLLRGARMQWDEPVGTHARTFSARAGAAATTVVFEVAPGRTTRFDCAALHTTPPPVTLSALPEAL